MIMNFIKRFFYFRSYLVLYLLFSFIFNIFLLGLPLTGTFGYEFAAVNGIFYAIFSGLHSLNFFSKSDYKFSDLTINLFILFLLPFLLVMIKSLLTMFCSFWDGLLFYLLISIPSIIFGVTLAIVLTSLFNRLKKTLFIFVIILVAVIPMLEIYFLPQVFFYSPLIGYFPGNIYDEGLSPDLTLFFHQLLILIICFIILIVLIKYRKVVVRIKYISLIAIVCIPVLTEILSVYTGYVTTFSKLDSILCKKAISEKFIIHYDNISENEAKYIALNTEYYYESISSELKVKPDRQIQVYIFNNREQKKKLFGAGNADVAKPWQYAIYISADSWESTLKHELVHVFSAEFGSGPFKIASGFNPALIEGLAEAIEGTADEYELYDFTSLAYQNNHRIDLSSLFSGLNFFKTNSSLSYSYSGAFFQFLIKKYGIEKVKEFYYSGNFEDVFNSDLLSDIKIFELEMLKSVSIGNEAMADYYFGRLSIIQKICPRFISDRLRIAYDFLKDKKLDKAEELFLEINSKTLNYAALSGLSEIYSEKNNFTKAINLLESKKKEFLKTPYYYILIFRLADYYALNDQSDPAVSYYDELIKKNANNDLVMLSKVRKKLVGTGLIKDFLGGNDSVMLSCIKVLNDSAYEYESVPLFINLMRINELKFEQVIKYFDKTFTVNDIESSFAAYRLSQYLLANGDYTGSRKYAALSLRFKDQNPYYFVMKENLRKATWFNNNYIKTLKSIQFLN